MAGMSRDHNLLKVFFLQILLSLECGNASSKCSNRRCLAQWLIEKEALSQPQGENCTQIVEIPFIEYQTVHVDTKDLRFSCQMKADILWTDPDLRWNKSDYDVDKVVLPVNKIWTPDLIVTNALQTHMKHASKDVLVYSNGTVRHTVIINSLVDCEINLFKYPFSSDSCPVAIQAWTFDGCGISLHIGTVFLPDSNHGDWDTEQVSLERKEENQNYILVYLSMKYLNPFISLILPSILILILDVVSFALPLGGGERNSFKVTLALSFIMFLIILNEILPGGHLCSPIIRTHFCVCLVFLVLSMTESMLLTRVTKYGLFPSCSIFKYGTAKTDDGEDTKEPVDEESNVDNGAIQWNEESEVLKKVVKFLDAIDAKDQESRRFEDLAAKLDKICFFLYLLMCVIYFSVLVYFFTSYPCVVDHFFFWY